MARIGRKIIVLDFGTAPEILDRIDQIKKKVRINMQMRMQASGKLEIEISGSKEEIALALNKIRDILSTV
jgi:hypothetical protein